MSTAMSDSSTRTKQLEAILTDFSHKHDWNVQVEPQYVQLAITQLETLIAQAEERAQVKLMATVLHSVGGELAITARALVDVSDDDVVEMNDAYKRGYHDASKDHGDKIDSLLHLARIDEVERLLAQYDSGRWITALEDRLGELREALPNNNGPREDAEPLPSE